MSHGVRGLRSGSLFLLVFDDLVGGEEEEVVVEVVVVVVVWEGLEEEEDDLELDIFFFDEVAFAVFFAAAGVW